MKNTDTLTYQEFLTAQRRQKLRKIGMIICVAVMLVGVIMAGIANFAEGYLTMGSFAVDSQGLLYVAFDEDILVYREGQLLYEYTEFPGMADVNTQDSVFTISEQDELILLAGSQSYTLDLQGNVLAVEPITSSPIGPEYTFTAANGDVYTRENILGRSTLVKNGTETVFQMPMETFVLRTVWLVSFGILFAGSVILIGLLVSGTGSMRLGKAGRK